MKVTKHKVNIIESEAGWGSKIDEVKYFDTKQDALEYCDEYNKSNTSKVVPSWYMVAKYDGIELVDVPIKYPFKLTYTSKNDLFYLKLTDQKISKQLEKDGVILDLDENGGVVGVEILFIKQKLKLKNENRNKRQSVK